MRRGSPLRRARPRAPPPDVIVRSGSSSGAVVGRLSPIGRASSTYSVSWSRGACSSRRDVRGEPAVPHGEDVAALRRADQLRGCRARRPPHGHGCSREHVLVQLDAPARARGTAQLAAADLGQRGDELVAPRDVVDVVLEDPRVRDRRAPLRGDERREVAVVVVRRAVDLERLGEVGDLLRLVEAVPDDVDRGDVDRRRPRGTAGSRGCRRGSRPSRSASARRAARARARPGRRGRPRARAGRTARAPSRPGPALRLEVEVEVDDRPRRAAGALGERLEQPHERVGDLVRLQRAAALVEARHEHRRLVARDDDVRLERAVAPLDDLAAERGDVVVGGELRRPGHLVRTGRVVPQCDQYIGIVSRVGPPKSS